ncbi:phage tail protein [Salmonella enterica subsp. enterica serovar Muenchen]|nr:phage tail protein [Salmonella enterica subsp. enterica serovar Muenchen]
MQDIKNFTPYKPESPVISGAAHLKSEDGRDWYECQKLFSPDTIKVEYDNNGIITCISRDISGFWPVGKSVAEVPDTEENRRADISGRWGFDGTDIIDLMTPDKAREQKAREIDAWRNKQENGSVTFTWNNHSWDASKASQDRLAPVLVVAKSGQLPGGFFWTDANNEDVPVTVDDLTAIDAGMTQAMVNMGWKIHERQREMKKEVDELMRVSDILNYSVGWPDNNSN